MSSDTVTRLLHDLRAGRAEAFDELLPQVYDALREIAHRQLRHERAGHTLQTTALVHEAYLKLVGGAVLDWQDRAHFFGVAARAMRQILISYARRRNAVKRGGLAEHVTFDDLRDGFTTGQTDRLLALDEALQQLEKIDLRYGKVVELRFYAGLTMAETAEVMQTSPATVGRDWRFARAWLRQALGEKGPAA